MLERRRELAGAAVGGAEALGELDRREVVRVDAVDDVAPAEMVERPVDGRGRRLMGIALTAGGLDQAPADFGAGPPFRLPGADTADPAAAFLLDYREHREAVAGPG